MKHQFHTCGSTTVLCSCWSSCITFGSYHPHGSHDEEVAMSCHFQRLCSLAVLRQTELSALQDPVRKEVPDAVAVCKRAGIFVRMVTGDNVHTASHIARECGIMMEGGLALEGPIFRKMTEEEVIPILPKLQVSRANSSRPM